MFFQKSGMIAYFEMVAVTVKLYDYDYAMSDHEADEDPPLLTGYSFAVKEHEDFKLDFLSRLKEKFCLPPSALIHLLSETSGEEVSSFDELFDKDELELYVLDIRLDSLEIDDHSVEVDDSFDVAGNYDCFELGIFNNSRIRKGVPRIGKKYLKFSDLEGDFESVSEKNHKQLVVSSDGRRIILYKDIWTSSCNAIQTIAKQKWIILLCHGGKFSGAVFNAGQRTASKTLKRYVQRRKQGKRQATQDKKKIAKSVGSSIRRAQEVRLQEDITELLVAWEEYFKSADLIFIHAPGHINLSSIYTKSTESFIVRSDPRICSVPVRTRSANSIELEHVFWTLSTVKCEFPSELV